MVVNNVVIQSGTPMIKACSYIQQLSFKTLWNLAIKLILFNPIDFPLTWLWIVGSKQDYTGAWSAHLLHSETEVYITGRWLVYWTQDPNQSGYNSTFDLLLWNDHDQYLFKRADNSYPLFVWSILIKADNSWCKLYTLCTILIRADNSSYMNYRLFWLININW